MPDCPSLDPLLTPYVDGALAPGEAAAVGRHLEDCAACRVREAAERAVRDLLGARRTALAAERAPEALRARCAALAAGRAAPRRPAPRARLAAAAVLVLVAGGALLAWLTQQSSRLLAAELAADHVKCFVLNAVLGTEHTPEAVEHYLADGFGRPIRLPAEPEAAGLQLVGARPCLSGHGWVAHIMYRHEGRPLSVFVLPGIRRAEELVGVLGHEAAIWSAGDRTFVVVARTSRDETARIAAFVRSGLR